MIKRILKKIEHNRNSKKLFWKLLIKSKDIIWRITNIFKVRNNNNNLRTKTPLFRNSEFNGDKILSKNIFNLIKNNKIDNVIETGTQYGNTTKFFGNIAKKVYSIESNKILFLNTKKRKDITKNVKFYCGESQKILNRIIPSLNGKSLFFLDAHGGKICPTPLELKIIAKHKIKPYILIHDFKNPIHPEFHFDAYPDFTYNFENIKTDLDKIYGKGGYYYEYNTSAIGEKVGVILIYDKKERPTLGKLFLDYDNNKKNIFITFGGPTSNYHEAVKRICNQAKSFKMFDKIIGYTDKDLIEDSEFYEQHKEFIINNKKGYGYWIWKPYLILKTLKQMNEGDLLLYCDCGCELNKKGRNKMYNLFKITNKKLIIGTKADSNDLNYTKMDLIKFFGMTKDINILKQPQMEASALLIKKCETTLKLFEEYYNTCSNNYNLINDTPSKSKNYPRFIEHRHDQSVFSLLVKKYGLINYSLGKTFFGPNWIWGTYYPIWTIRNKSGSTLLYSYKKKINIINRLDSLIGKVGIFIKLLTPRTYKIIKQIIKIK